ncbi:hypothetical protein EDC01DRAFT_728383 [Geopyxis carbonaria]|nr:hypothetical protein EDC01DRAFT_728383 [Geopyxis carbonaria]
MSAGGLAGGLVEGLARGLTVPSITYKPPPPLLSIPPTPTTSTTTTTSTKTHATLAIHPSTHPPIPPSPKPGFSLFCNNANLFGNNDISPASALGPWWPYRVCAMRDGVEAGIVVVRRLVHIPS